MSKYQDALDNVLKDNIKVYSTRSDIHKDIRLLKELINKENPMKPKKKKYGKGSEWVCPNCKSHIAYFDELGIGTVPVIKYCRECGQRLDLDCGKNE